MSMLLRRVVREAAQRVDADSRKGEQSARRALQQHGIEFVSATTPEEVERWHDLSARAMTEVRKEGVYDETIIDEIGRHLADYRKGAGGS